MLGLGNYASSSEDEIESEKPLVLKQDSSNSPVKASQIREEKAQNIPDAQSTKPEPALDREPSGPVLGPLHEGRPLQASVEARSTLRTLIHDLTLPPVPNLNIPPSPPGSPNASANGKFAHFLLLKKQDVHFNDKLASSTSLKNPSLLKKMMEHTGIDEQAQYSNSLPPDLWDVPLLPSWGYKEELAKAQGELNAKSEERRVKGQRDTIEFVSDSSGTGSVSQHKTRPRH
ncbi:HCNGP-like protein-domain-containing protein [Aspergillus venezuelensis]